MTTFNRVIVTKYVGVKFEDEAAVFQSGLIALYYRVLRVRLVCDYGNRMNSY